MFSTLDHGRFVLSDPVFVKDAAHDLDTRSDCGGLQSADLLRARLYPRAQSLARPRRSGSDDLEVRAPFPAF